MICRPALFFLLFLFSTATVFSQDQQPVPSVAGYVTRSISLEDFDVNGVRVLTNDKTAINTYQNIRQGNPSVFGPYFGQSVDVYGKLDRKKHEVTAANIVFHTFDKKEIGGFAIIDRVLSPAKTTGGQTRMVIRADGYSILVTSSSKISFQAPLASLFGVTTNVWIKYRGKLRPDGIVQADTVSFLPNAIPAEEAKLREKSDYDAAVVDPNAKQSVASEMYRGADPKQIPPYKDAAMQARIDRIGKSVVPAYQQNLPASDLTKIFFHFQLIDRPDFSDCWALPSGVVLVPRHIPDQLTNDSQLAAVLASSVADVLEKQAYRSQANRRNRKKEEIASIMSGFSPFGPVSMVNLELEGSYERNAEDQSGRVSLGLLHDAGYDISQAPIAWWQLRTKTGKDLADTPIPPRSLNLYKSIGITWHAYSDPSEPSSTVLQTK
jgi:hypothetical protein